MSSTISKERFSLLLEKAKKASALRQEQAKLAELSELAERMQVEGVVEVELSTAGAGPNSTEEEKEEIVSSLLEGVGRGEVARAPSTEQLPVSFSLRERTTSSFPERTTENAQSLLPTDSNINSVSVNSELDSNSSPSTRVRGEGGGEEEGEEERREVEVEKKGIGVTRNVTLNSKQSLFNSTVLSGSSCVLIGAAGTGKTTSMRTVTRSLLDSSLLKPLEVGTRYLRVGKPGAAILSFTRKAVNNIRHAVVEELKEHTLTLHKLLEFAPEFFERLDSSSGEMKKTMRFLPTRTAYNPLPSSLSFIAFEESSMISTELYNLLQEALPHEHQEVFLGDIQQLPPIFGSAILGFKMLSLPVIELTEVYRQAADSPIIDLAWKILAGKEEVFSPVSTTITVKGKKRIAIPSLDKLSRKVVDKETGEETGEVKFQVWQKQLTEDYTISALTKQFIAWTGQNYYNPEEDVILCPFNKGVGTIELNKGLSNFLGKERGAEVHEVIAGFQKHYIAVGDRVLYDKEDAFITKITRNGRYLGKSTLPSSSHLDRWGHIAVEEMSATEKLALESQEVDAFSLDALDSYLSSRGEEGEEGRVVMASHVVELRYAYQDSTDAPVVLDNAGEINNLLGGYVITVHKFQGSEAERVFLIYHHSHHVGVMMSREAIYTAVTRAKKFLHIIAEKDSFYKAVKLQVIKGNTIEEKAEFFKGKKELLGEVK